MAGDAPLKCAKRPKPSGISASKRSLRWLPRSDRIGSRRKWRNGKLAFALVSLSRGNNSPMRLERIPSLKKNRWHMDRQVAQTSVCELFEFTDRPPQAEACATRRADRLWSFYKKVCPKEHAVCELNRSLTWRISGTWNC